MQKTLGNLLGYILKGNDSIFLWRNMGGRAGGWGCWGCLEMAVGVGAGGAAGTTMLLCFTRSRQPCQAVPLPILAPTLPRPHLHTLLPPPTAPTPTPHSRSRPPSSQAAPF